MRQAESRSPLPAAVPEEARRQFLERGYWAASRLLDAAGVRRVVSWIDELRALPDSPDRHWSYYEERPAGRLLSRIENFEPHHAQLAALLRGPQLRGVAGALLGEEAILFKDKINFKLPGGGGFEPHQDSQAGWEVYAPWFVTAAVALDEATVANGCLELARWKHRRELIGPLWEPLSPEALAEVVFEPLPMAPGDAVFFDSYLPHRSSPNPTAHARRLIYVTYNRSSDGDQRVRYYADKRASFPPDCVREPGKEYRYRV